MHEHLGYASIAAVNQYLRFAEARQLNIPQALTAAGIDVARLEDASGRIKGREFQALLLNLIEQSDDALLGLNSSQYVQPGSYQILGYIVMNCATLGEVVQRIAPYEALVGDMGTTDVIEEQKGPEKRIRIRWNCAYPDPIVKPQMVDNVLGSWVNFARWLAAREDEAPERVVLQRPTPPLKLVRRYEEVFQCPVHFGQADNALIIDAAVLDTPLRQPDAHLRSTLESHASRQIEALQAVSAGSFDTQVAALISEQLRRGACNQTAIVAALNITPRTMQRRLKDCGTSYQTLLDQRREGVARQLLVSTDMTAAEIANQLGFAETRSFHRRFKSWTGLTPGEYRKSAKTAPQTTLPSEKDDSVVRP